MYVLNICMHMYVVNVYLYVCMYVNDYNNTCTIEPVFKPVDLENVVYMDMWYSYGGLRMHQCT